MHSESSKLKVGPTALWLIECAPQNRL